MKNKEMGVIYSLIQERVKDIQAPKNFIWRKDLFVIFGRIYHIQKPFRHAVMNEMIDCGMLKKVKNDFLEIL